MLERIASEFTAGDLVGHTFGVWWRNLGAFTTVTALASMPVFLGFGVVGFLAAAGRRAGAAAASPAAAIGPVMVAMLVVGAALFAIQLGALTHGALADLSGRKARIGELLGVGARRAISTLLVTVVVYLACVGGTLLLVVPGIVVACMLCVSVPVALAERTGINASLRRSAALTSGRRLTLFATFFLIVGAVTTVNMVANVVLTLALPSLGPIAAIGAALLILAVTVVLGSIPTIVPAVAYHHLRILKEGYGTEEVAKVFE